MKGGLVVIAFALKALAATGGLDAVVPVRLVIVERRGGRLAGGAGGHRRGDHGLERARSSSRRAAQADAIITRRKGTGGDDRGRPRTRGARRQRPQGRRERASGRSRASSTGAELTDYDRGVTVNVGRVAGGQSKNTVPDRAEAQLDLRFCTRGRRRAPRRSPSVRAAEQAAADVPGTRIELQRRRRAQPLERTEASAALLAEYARCARAHGLGGDEAPLIGGGSDASTSSALGIPSIDGLGPRGTGFHTKDELIEVATPRAQGAGARAVSRRRAARA